MSAVVKNVKHLQMAAKCFKSCHSTEETLQIKYQHVLNPFKKNWFSALRARELNDAKQGTC